MYYVNLELKGQYGLTGQFQPDFGLLGNADKIINNNTLLEGQQTNLFGFINIQASSYWSQTQVVSPLSPCSFAANNLQSIDK